MFIRRMREHRFGGRRGFTLIELAIVLAVTSLLTAGLWRMMSSGNTQLRDQAAAEQHKTLINSVRAYLASPAGQTRLLAASVPFVIDLDETALDPYLPVGFGAATTNSYGQVYGVHVVKSPATAAVRPDFYSFMIKTVNGTSGETIPDTSGGRISSMIGSDGGFVYTASVCGGSGGDMACGAFGSWSAAPTTIYGYADTNGGQVASRTFVGSSAELDTPWLARIDMDSASATIHNLNTIQTPISFGGQDLVGTDVTGVVSDGSITKLKNMQLANFDEASLSVGRSPFCTKNQPTDETDPALGGCPDVAQFNGDINITGLLKAKKLYAEQFVYDASDRRLKHDIVPLTNTLDKLANVKGYSFRMNRGDEQKYGVIAQELEKEFPILVHDIGDGFKGVDYVGLVGPLVAAVNELKQQNDELKKTLELQGKMIEELKKTKGK